MVDPKEEKNPQFMSISEAAAYLNVTTATLRNWDKAGKLTPYRHPINQYRLYSKEEIKDFINGISKFKK
ncbi:helix-turn-helix domain-containing protein [Bombella sp. ESL0378]|uniref:MerR family DNA-binding transcriptional regulator n=1 Tax=Bombella sp. ESL0378 TaxID=2676442 RepID=UPI0012D87238|nr:MerR family DNA-binding transcriptional regulator [Bombella sp. ESL0378]MUG05574.1 helix-turn-helix domain-containing protein [Bombella sp. ESL0378]